MSPKREANWLSPEDCAAPPSVSISFDEVGEDAGLESEQKNANWLSNRVFSS